MKKEINSVLAIVIILFISILFIGAITLVVSKNNLSKLKDNTRLDNKTSENKDSSIKNDNKINEKESESTIIENSNQQSSFYENMKKNRKVIATTNVLGDQIVVDKDGNVYSSFNPGNNTTKQTYTIEGLTYNYPGQENKFTGYKIDINNVISTYCYHMGNGGMYVWIFIKQDGTIGTIYYSDYDKTLTSIKNTISRFKNIISAVSISWGQNINLIDIDGNVYHLELSDIE